MNRIKFLVLVALCVLLSCSHHESQRPQERTIIYYVEEVPISGKTAAGKPKRSRRSLRGKTGNGRTHDRTMIEKLYNEISEMMRQKGLLAGDLSNGAMAGFGRLSRALKTGTLRDYDKTRSTIVTCINSVEINEEFLKAKLPRLKRIAEKVADTRDVKSIQPMFDKARELIEAGNYSQANEVLNDVFRKRER